MQDCKECFSVSPGRGEVRDTHVGIAINHSPTPQQQCVFGRRVVCLTRHKYVSHLNTHTHKHTHATYSMINSFVSFSFSGNVNVQFHTKLATCQLSVHIMQVDHHSQFCLTMTLSHFHFEQSSAKHLVNVSQVSGVTPCPSEDKHIPILDVLHYSTTTSI